jgi:hypothetical protein
VKKFITLVAFVWTGLIAMSAYGDDTISWEHPNSYVPVAPATTGDPLNVADIDSTIIRFGDGTPANPPTVISSVTVLAPATSVVVARDPTVAGSRCYQAATLMKSGAQSIFAPSAWVCKAQEARKPRPPRNVVVQ